MQPKLSLKTVAVRDDGCFSVLLDGDGRPFAVTVERTLDDVLPVIRAGRYQCVRDFYHKGGYPTFEIVIPGHTRVLFHKGNRETDSLACVIVGENFGELSNETAVLQSKAGFGEFWDKYKGFEKFVLEVSGR